MPTCPRSFRALSAKHKDPTLPAPRDLTLQTSSGGGGTSALSRVPESPTSLSHICAQGHKGPWHWPRALEYSRCLRIWPPLTTSALLSAPPQPPPKSALSISSAPLTTACSSPHTPAQVPPRPHPSTPRASPQEPFPPSQEGVFMLPLCPWGSLGTLATHTPCTALATLRCNGCCAREVSAPQSG